MICCNHCPSTGTYTFRPRNTVNVNFMPRTVTVTNSPRFDLRLRGCCGRRFLVGPPLPPRGSTPVGGRGKRTLVITVENALVPRRVLAGLAVLVCCMIRFECTPALRHQVAHNTKPCGTGPSHTKTMLEPRRTHGQVHADTSQYFHAGEYLPVTTSAPPDAMHLGSLHGPQRQ